MKALRLAILGFLASGCSDVKPQPKPITIQTPQGTVTAHESAVPSTPQQIRRLSELEVKEITSPALRGSEFLSTYLPDTGDASLSQYDQAFRAWQTSDSPKHSPDEVIQILGSCLGNKCVADLDMEWVTVTDEYGTDYAIRSKTYDVMGFPFSTVSKRIEDRKYDFMDAVYHLLKNKVEAGDSKRLDP
jgi:hypothetical protein